MPLLVTETSPDKKALLLLPSSQLAAPSMKVGANSRAYSSEAMVSGLLRMTLSSASTTLPPWDHRIQWAQALPSPLALPSAKPPGCPFSLSFVISVKKSAVLSGIPSKPASWTWETR